MRLLRSWTLPLHPAPARAYTALARTYKADPYTRVVHEDPATRTLRMEGPWWYRGELSVVPGDGGGSLATLRVHSTARGLARLASWVAERRGLRFAEQAFRDAVRDAAEARAARPAGTPRPPRGGHHTG